MFTSFYSFYFLKVIIVRYCNFFRKTIEASSFLWSNNPKKNVLKVLERQDKHYPKPPNSFQIQSLKAAEVENF